MRLRPASIDPADVAVLDGLADHLDAVLAELSEGRWNTRPPDDEESPRDYEVRQLSRKYGPGGDWTEEAAGIAVTYCSLQLTVASHHLAALECTLRERLVFFPPAVLARSILEASGYIAWLLDPRIDSRRRAARAYLARLDDLTRARTVAAGLGHPGAGKRAEEVAALRRRLTGSIFYPSEVSVQANGKLHLVGQSLPTLSGSLRYLQEVTNSQAWDAQSAYAMLSNATHPTPHVPGEMLYIDGDTVRMTMADTVYPYRVTRVAVSAFLDVWQLYAAYLGYGQEPMRRLKNELASVPEPTS